MAAKTIWPAEWAPQACILLAWPHKGTDWYKNNNLKQAQTTYLNVMAEILTSEPVILIVPDTTAITQIKTALKKTKSLDNLYCIIATYNDTWLRDTGPLTLFHNLQPQLLLYRFNGWGKKYPYAKDQNLIETLHKNGDFNPLFSQTPTLQKLNRVAECGNLEHNGAGLLLTQSQCLLHKNRNQDLNKQNWERHFLTTLGIKQVLWVTQGQLEGDDTDGHIDTLARFCSPTNVCYQSCDEPNYSAYTSLKALEKQLITLSITTNPKLTLVPLPWPDPVTDENGRRLPANYANFLIINEKVLVPTYQVSTDKQALTTLQSCFPDHSIVGIDSRALIKQYGSLHCIAMQIPKSQ